MSSKLRGVWAFLAIAILAGTASYFVMDHLKASIAPSVDTSLRAVLARAEWASVFRKSGKVEIPFATLGPAVDENPELFRALVRGVRYGAPVPKQEPDLYFNIRFIPESGGHGRIAHFGYVIKSGALGRGDEWATVPPELKNWLMQLDARTPEKEWAIVPTPGGKVATPVPPEMKRGGE